MPTAEVREAGGLESGERLGCHVTGIEPSPRSVEVARQHAAASGLPIDYRIGAGEHLPFADQTFDVVYCCDVLEHVDDLEQVIAESARVLRPGGLYLFDTINRTVRSWLVAIKLFQDWESTRFMEPDLHDWHVFIKPRELRRSLARHGLQPRQFIGLVPSPNPIAAIRLMRRRRRGELTYGQFARALGMREGRDTSVSYAGSAIKLTQPSW